MSSPMSNEQSPCVDTYMERLKARRNNHQPERDYRRGYMHGYDKALVDIAHALNRMYRGDAMDFLSEFFDEELTPWRIRYEEGFQPPPDARTYQRRPQE